MPLVYTSPERRSCLLPERVLCPPSLRPLWFMPRIARGIFFQDAVEFSQPMVVNLATADHSVSDAP